MRVIPNILNLGCGGQRPQEMGWINLDDLHSQLEPGSGARAQLDKELNYVNYKIWPGARLPFPDSLFNGVLASHFFEHFDIQESRKILLELKRIMLTDAPLLISVPNAEYFRDVHHHDKNANWEELFGVVDTNNPIPTFMEAALFFEQHKVLFTQDSLWCLLTQEKFRIGHGIPTDDPILMTMAEQLNRRKFSLEMIGYNIK